MPRRIRVFLSHAVRNRSIADRVTKALADHGLDVWYSRHAIRGAQQWHDEIGAALRRCNWFVIILSPEAVRSKWVKRELLYALQDDRYENHIVPLLYRRCDHNRLSWTLSSFQFIAFAGGFDKGCRHLLRTWGIEYRARKRTPGRRSTRSRRR